jgi:hypothetical protein
MSAKIWVGGIAIACVLFGVAKAIWPQFFLELRRRYPWFDLFDIYSFIFKSEYAEQVVRINGYLLLAIGIGLLVWVIYK